MNRLKAWFGIVVIAVGFVFVMPPQKASAVPVYVQSAVNGSHNSASITTTFSTAPTSGNLIIAICSADIGTITAPTGFSTARYDTATRVQGIYYKISNGTETNINCTTSSSFNILSIHEFSGIDTNNPLMGTPGTATGTSTTPGSGSTTTNETDALLVAGLTTGAQTSFASWTNSFTERTDFALSSGSPGSRITAAAATRIVPATGTYSTSATATSGAWRGQIVAFRASLAIPVLSVDIVDASGNSVSNPSATFSAINSSFECQVSTSTLGTSSQRIRLTNTTTSPAWSLSIAATAGATASWTSGSNSYDYNDTSGSTAGCADGSDADSLAGALTVNGAFATITPSSGCNTTGVSLYSSSSFNEGVLDSKTLMTGSSSAQTNCHWDLTNVSLSQRVPAGTPPGTYTLGLTITVVAN